MPITFIKNNVYLNCSSLFAVQNEVIFLSKEKQ